MLSSASFFALMVFILAFASIASLYAALSANRAGRVGSWNPKSSRSASARSMLAREQVEWHWLPRRLLDLEIKRLRDLQSRKPALQRLQTALMVAGYSGIDAIAIFRMLRVICTGLGLAAGILLAISLSFPRILLAVMGAFAGYILPQLALERLRRKRQARLARELPVILDLLVVSLEAGLSITEAIRLVGKETERQGRQLGAELSAAAAEMVAGVTLADSLNNLAARTGDDDIRSVAALLIQSEKIGARLGPALRASANQLTVKRRMRAEEAAQKCTIKMLLPLVLLILPAMMIVILGPAVIRIIHVLKQ